MTCLCGKGEVHWCVRMAHQLTFVARMGLFDEKCMQVNKNPTDSHLQWGWGLLVFKNSLLTYVWVCFIEKCMQINKNPTDSCLQWGWGLLLWYLVWVVLKDECYKKNFFPSILWCSLMFSTATWPRSTHSAQLAPSKYLCPLVSVAFPPHSCVSTTFIISIMDALCLGYHGTISESFGQSWNIIRSIVDTLRHFYHLNHVSTLRRFRRNFLI